MARASSTVVASGAGPSILTLRKSLPAGSYRFQVNGSGKSGCSFTLTVEYVNPQEAKGPVAGALRLPLSSTF